MKFEIVNEVPKSGDLIINFDINIELSTLLETSEYVASQFIRDLYGIKYFQSLDSDNWGNENDDIVEKPLNGFIYLTYPLSVVVKLYVENIKTIGSLLWQIAKVYEQIYLEESISTNTPIFLEDNDRGMVYNRNKTDGKYGIMYHDIEDLVFEFISIYDNGIIKIGIGS